MQNILWLSLLILGLCGSMSRLTAQNNTTPKAVPIAKTIPSLPPGNSSVVRQGPMYKIPHHQRVLRFLKGGDQHYYLFTASSGSSGSFSRDGESAVILRRFSPQLQLTHQTKIRRYSRSQTLPNVYEVMPTQQGIAILSMARVRGIGKAELLLCDVDFSTQQASFACRTLTAMPDHIPGLSNPNLKLTWAGDSSVVALSWRRLANFEDNSLAVLLLDKQLKPLGEPLYPLQKFNVPVLMDDLILGVGNDLILMVKTYDGNSLTQSQASSSSGFIYYNRKTRQSTKVLLANKRMIPLTMKGQTNHRLGFTSLMGIYAAWEKDSLTTGIYLGTIAELDTIPFLKTFPFNQEISNFFVRRFKEKDFSLSHRRIINDALQADFSWETGYWFRYWLELGGIKNEEKAKAVKHPGHSLFGFLVNGDQLIETDEKVFFQPADEEFWQMGSFSLVKEKGCILYNDYAGKGRKSSLCEFQSHFYPPVGAATQDGALAIPHAVGKRDLAITSPRHFVRVDHDHYVFLQRYRHNLRLVLTNL